MDGYNVGRLLWSKTTGDNLLQNLLPDNSTSTLTAMTAGHLANTGASMGYDGDGLRAWKQNDAGTRTYFLYDGSDPVCELDSSGNVSAVNTFGATGLLSRRVTGGSSVFYTFDERGNVAQRTDAGANVLSSDLYDGYGKKMAGGAAGDPWGYGAQAGYYTDAETGLVLCTHRFYDPQTGRFITRDPMGYGGGVNLYGYTGNNPANWSDPSGFDTSNDGTVFNDSGTTQYGLGGYEPGKYKPIKGGSTGIKLVPIPPNKGPIYPVYPIAGAPGGDNYMFPVQQGQTVGGNGVDIDAGWDPYSKLWIKTPGTLFNEIHGHPLPFSIRLPNTGTWSLRDHGCRGYDGDNYQPTISGKDFSPTFRPGEFGPGGTDFSKDDYFPFPNPSSIRHYGRRG